MVPAVVTAAELQRRIAERSARIGIIGQGYVGLPLAVEFARVGFAVTGFDTSADRVVSLNAGRSHTPDVAHDTLRARLEAGRYETTTTLAGLAECDAVIICVPTPLRKSTARTPPESWTVSERHAPDLDQGRRPLARQHRRAHPELSDAARAHAPS